MYPPKQRQHRHLRQTCRLVTSSRTYWRLKAKKRKPSAGRGVVFHNTLNTGLFDKMSFTIQSNHLSMEKLPAHTVSLLIVNRTRSSDDRFSLIVFIGRPG